MKSTKSLVMAALLAAFTCIATMIIKIPTPTLGYIHLGDGLVLLCSVILGPFTGALAAGIGSMFADFFSGYIVFAPATLVIKALTALISGLIYHKLRKLFTGSRYTSMIIAGTVGESFMVLGYFLFEIFISMSASGTFNQTTLTAGIVASSAGISFNVVQGLVGIIIALLLLPVVTRLSIKN